MQSGPTLVLLPGMDGTGKLFRPLLDVIPSHWPTRVISYPTDRTTTYADLLQQLEHDLAGSEKLILIAESYSGPIALRFAVAHPQRVAAVVLCASFISSPLPQFLKWVAVRWLFWFRPPRFVLRRLLLGPNAPDSLVTQVRDTIAEVSPRVMARRIKDVFELQCADALRACTAPILYLAGARDVLVRPHSVATIQVHKPEIEVHELDAPHLLLQTQPARAWEQINSFFNGLTALRV